MSKAQSITRLHQISNWETERVFEVRIGLDDRRHIQRLETRTRSDGSVKTIWWIRQNPPKQFPRCATQLTETIVLTLPIATVAIVTGSCYENSRPQKIHLLQIKADHKVEERNYLALWILPYNVAGDSKWRTHIFNHSFSSRQSFSIIAAWIINSKAEGSIEVINR